MKRYNKHIKTGYKFLPLIPVNWDLKLGLSCFEENKKKNTELVEKLLLQFKYGTIVRKANQEIKKDDELTFAKYTVVEPNDIILNGLNLNYDFVSQRVGIVKEKGDTKCHCNGISVMLCISLCGMHILPQFVEKSNREKRFFRIRMQRCGQNAK